MPRKDLNAPPVAAARLDRYLNSLSTTELAKLQAEYELTIRPGSHVDRSFQLHGWQNNHLLRDFRMWVLCRLIDEQNGERQPDQPA